MIVSSSWGRSLITDTKSHGKIPVASRRVPWNKTRQFLKGLLLPIDCMGQEVENVIAHWIWPRIALPIKLKRHWYESASHQKKERQQKNTNIANKYSRINTCLTYMKPIGKLSSPMHDNVAMCEVNPPATPQIAFRREGFQ